MANQIAVIEGEFRLPDRITTQDRLKEIEDFQSLVKSQLKIDHDFGTIPGTKTPTLYKPGAEKIIKLLGLADTYEIIDTVEDWGKPIFSYTIRCSLLWQGEIISQGLGECNTMEGRYRWRWAWPNEVDEADKPGLKVKEWRAKNRDFKQYRIENDDVYTLRNTVLKMSEKRAKVDAALSVGRLSDLFTQDMEDRSDYGNNETVSEPAQQDAPVYSKPEPAEPFDADNPVFANKGAFVKAARDVLEMSQRMIFDALSVDTMADVTDDLVGHWKTLESFKKNVLEKTNETPANGMNLIPPKE